MKRNIINKSVLKKVIEQSEICQHVINELKISGVNINDVFYQKIIELSAILSETDVSGINVSIIKNPILDITKKLVNFELLKPLTLKDDEWLAIDNEGTMRNKRVSSIFKDKNKNIYDINAYECNPYRFSIYNNKLNNYEDLINPLDKRIINIENNNTIFEIYQKPKNYDLTFTGRYFSKCYIELQRDGTYMPLYTPIRVPVCCVIYNQNFKVNLADSFDFQLLYDKYNIEFKSSETLTDLSVFLTSNEVMENLIKKLEKIISENESIIRKWKTNYYESK